MSTYKRRIVYLSDEEWEEVKGNADADGRTASAYIRSLLMGGRLMVDADAAVATVRPMTQAERDAILRRVNKG